MTNEEIGKVAKKMADYAIESLQKKFPDIEPELVETIHKDVEAWIKFCPPRDELLCHIDTLTGLRARDAEDSVWWYREIKDYYRSKVNTTWEWFYIKMIQDGFSPFLVRLLHDRLLFLSSDITNESWVTEKDKKELTRFILDKISEEPLKLYEKLCKKIKETKQAFNEAWETMSGTEMNDVVLNRCFRLIYNECFCSRR